MERRKRSSKTAIVVAVINGMFGIIAAIISVYFGSQLYSIQNQTQQINVNVINALGEYAISEMNISESSDIAHVTDELSRAFVNADRENKELKQQVSALKSFVLEEYTSSEVDYLISEGYIKETPPVRLDQLECLDGEYYEIVDSVRDLYGTTHSMSYKMFANYERVSWIKFKLDGKYDWFSASAITSEETSRDSLMSVEIYVDGVIVSRLDDIVRDENVRTINANVSNGNVLMIKLIGTYDIGGNTCYISDTELTKLN